MFTYRPWRFWIPSHGPPPVPKLHFGNHSGDDLSSPKVYAARCMAGCSFSMCDKSIMLGTFLRGVVLVGVSQVVEVHHCGSCQETRNKRPSGEPSPPPNLISLNLWFVSVCVPQCLKKGGGVGWGEEKKGEINEWVRVKQSMCERNRRHLRSD